MTPEMNTVLRACVVLLEVGQHRSLCEAKPAPQWNRIRRLVGPLGAEARHAAEHESEDYLLYALQKEVDKIRALLGGQGVYRDTWEGHDFNRELMAASTAVSELARQARWDAEERGDARVPPARRRGQAPPPPRRGVRGRSPSVSGPSTRIRPPRSQRTPSQLTTMYPGERHSSGSWSTSQSHAATRPRRR